MSNLAQRLQRVAPALTSARETPVQVPFGEWTPDLPDLDNPGLTVCRNAIPVAGAYRPSKDLTGVSLNALNTRALGGISALVSLLH